jgi:hypothetical protein
MNVPYRDEHEWGYPLISPGAGKGFWTDRAPQPALQDRLGVARMHPRSALSGTGPLPPDVQIDDRPTKRGTGFHVGVMPGLDRRRGAPGLGGRRRAAYRPPSSAVASSISFAH